MIEILGGRQELTKQQLLSEGGNVRISLADGIMLKRVVGFYIGTGNAKNPLSRYFTKQLTRIYNQLSKRQIQMFDIIYVSCDECATDFSETYQNMPWKAFPFDTEQDQHLRIDILAYFYPAARPTLIIIRIDNGQILTKNGCTFIERMETDAIDQWIRGETGICPEIPNEEFVWKDLKCQVCNQQPLRGYRAHCSICEDFDVCNKCVNERKIEHEHQLYVLTTYYNYD